VKLKFQAILLFFYLYIHIIFSLGENKNSECEQSAVSKLNINSPLCDKVATTGILALQD